MRSPVPSLADPTNLLGEPVAAVAVQEDTVGTTTYPSGARTMAAVARRARIRSSGTSRATRRLWAIGMTDRLSMAPVAAAAAGMGTAMLAPMTGEGATRMAHRGNSKAGPVARHRDP